MTTPEMFTRSVPFELRDTGDGRTLAGYAAVFNSPTRIQERGQTFDETIAPGAFSRTINAANRVVMQFEHGQHPFFGSLPIARIDTLREDTHGLYVEARLNDSWMVEPVRDAIANEAVSGMSFRFSVPDGGDTWDRSGETAQRTINEVRLYELGPVVHPAYEDTTVGVRGALNLLDDDQRAAMLRQIADPAENAAALELIAQMQTLAAQLVAMEADALAGGDDTLDELSTLVCVLTDLQSVADDEAGIEPAADSGDMQENSKTTPDEGSSRGAATPDEGSGRPRTITQRRAALALANL